MGYMIYVVRIVMLVIKGLIIFVEGDIRLVIW